MRRIESELLQPLGMAIVKAAFERDGARPRFDLSVKVDEAIVGKR